MNRISIKGRLYIVDRCKDCGIEYSVRSDNKSAHMGYCKKCSYAHRKWSQNKYVVCNVLLSKYSSMKTRCYNENSPKYKRYGGRGISVCEEWKNSFKSFQDWAISNGYDKSLSIDRINNDGNYEPSNCRWIPLVENTIKDRRILNAQQRLDIRTRIANGEKKSNLAKEFLVSKQVIGYISKTKEIL